MAKTFTDARARYENDRQQACIAAGDSLRETLGVDFRISQISRSALDAVHTQWKSSEFDWDKINTDIRGIDAFKFAIWVGDRLCGLAVATTSNQRIRLRFLEGSPLPDCPLKGRRITIALEAVAFYGQRRGKRELTLEPLNEKLISVYQNTYGFQIIRPHSDPPYALKGI